jgi:peptide/nickel transport system permease protein
MGNYVVRRLLAYVPVLFGISILVFGLMRLIPGDAVSVMMGQIRMEPETEESLRRLFGIDKPIWRQYTDWMGAMLQGDMGVSIRSGRPVTTEIGVSIGPTVQLAVAAAIIGCLIAIPAGVISAVRQYSLADTIVTLSSYLGISMPVFWLGTLLILLFSVKLSWLPAGGYASMFDSPVESLRFVALPALTLGLGFAALLMRVIRSAMLEVLRQDYVQVARAKGLRETPVLLRHVARNTLIPVLTVIGLQFGWLLGGSVIVEQVFVRPGIGRLLLGAIFNRDYPVVQGVALLFALIFLTTNLLVDLTYSAADPRIRYE